MSVGVAVIGTGFMGQCHARAWHSVRTVFDDVPSPRLEVVCDIDAAQAAAAASAFGFARAMTDWREAIADDAVDAVSITVPNALHAPVASAALARGKHVWCEKPMAATLADAELLAHAAAAASPSLVAALGYNYLRNPALDHAARLVAGGAIGRLAHVQGVIDEDYAADPLLPWSWRDSRRQAGLGVLGDLMSHLVAIVHALAGRITRVCGQTATVHRHRPAADGGTRPVENEDTAQALIRFAHGATGTLAASRVACGRKNRIALELHGTSGTIAFDQERMNELRLFDQSGDPATRGFRTVLTGPAHPPYGRFCPAPGHGLGFNDLKVIEAAQFLRAIAGAGVAPTGFAEGLAIERVLHAIAAGHWVDLPEA